MHNQPIPVAFILLLLVGGLELQEGYRVGRDAYRARTLRLYVRFGSLRADAATLRRGYRHAQTRSNTGLEHNREAS